MKLFGLFIWKNDNPITGNVLGLQNIVEPRKAIEQYRVGDLVSVRLPSYVKAEGIIGMIGDESKKKELQSVLGNDVQFYTLVEKLIPGKRKDDKHEKESLDQPLTKCLKINHEKAAEAQRQHDLGEQSHLQQEDEIKEQDTSGMVRSAFNVLNNPGYVQQPSRLASLNQPKSAFVCYQSSQIERRVADLEASVETCQDQLWRHVNAMQSDFIWLNQQKSSSNVLHGSVYNKYTKMSMVGKNGHHITKFSEKWYLNWSQDHPYFSNGITVLAIPFGTEPLPPRSYIVQNDYRYHYECVRLATFSQYQGSGFGTRLAQSGFVYDVSRSMVVCPWDGSDVSSEITRNRHIMNCAFVRQFYQINIPLHEACSPPLPAAFAFDMGFFPATEEQPDRIQL